MGEMRLDRPLADVQLAGDLFVGFAVGEQLKSQGDLAGMLSVAQRQQEVAGYWRPLVQIQMAAGVRNRSETHQSIATVVDLLERHTRDLLEIIQ